jgi:hypothetical protein
MDEVIEEITRQINHLQGFKNKDPCGKREIPPKK